MRSDEVDSNIGKNLHWRLLSSNESSDILVTFKQFFLVELAFEITKWVDIVEKQKKTIKHLSN